RRGPNFRRTVGEYSLEARRRDADNGEIGAVECDRLPDYFRIRAKPPPPQSVAENRHCAHAGRGVVFRREGSAFDQSYAERAEVVFRDEFAGDLVKLRARSRARGARA